jgi:hypothetical protein
MAEKEKKETKQAPAVEIIADDRPLDTEPVLVVRTGKTEGKTFFVKINQPSGRALMVAVHL